MLLRHFLTLLTCLLLPLNVAWGHPHLLQLSTGQEVSQEAFFEDIGRAQVIFIGELHGHDGHHQMQLEIIRALQKQGRPLAVGLEMFQQDYQGALDQWVAGDMPEQNFLLVYHQNWSMWPKYRPIFMFARDHNLPLIGLNIPREITRQVSRFGFDSLNPEQRRDLEGIACEVDPTYMEFIRRALGGHGHNLQNFTFFCEAQLLWDAVMARNLMNFLEDNPNHQVVVLSGSGHSWKHGIPHQLHEMGGEHITYRVVLPEVHGRIDRTDASVADADYLWLDFGADGWSFED
jgi:uncharacterized iron-regulated protein